MKPFLAFLKRWRLSERGGIMMNFALIAPGVILLGVGGIDLTAVYSAKTRLQTIADAAALAGAPSLALATDGAVAKEQAQAFFVAEMEDWADAPEVTPTYEIVQQAGQRALKVHLAANRPSFFVNLMPPGGWDFNAQAIATSVGMVPLCVLVTGSTNSKLLNLKDSSRMNAPACMVHSNRDIDVEGSAAITSAAAQAVTSARGYIIPSPNTGAAKIDDPFGHLPIDQKLAIVCSIAQMLTPLKATSGTHYISAGKHCGGIELSGTAKGILRPGDHMFLGGHLIVKENARLEGQDVVLFFDKDSKFEFKDKAMVNLDGRKSGTFAGIVMGGMRGNTNDFIISSDNVETLLGVIYVPSAKLIIEGHEDVARESAWTVIVAKSVELKGSPSLFINANYDASDVPVPQGVGPRGAGSRLIE